MYTEIRGRLDERFDRLSNRLDRLEKSAVRHEKRFKRFYWIPWLGMNLWFKGAKEQERLDRTRTSLYYTQLAIQACDEENIDLLYLSLGSDLHNRLWICNHRVLLVFRNPGLYERLGKLVPELKSEPSSIGLRDIETLSNSMSWLWHDLDDVLPVDADLKLPSGIMSIDL